MYELLNIPEHKTCQNCGECCGVVPASKKEIENIKQYLNDNPEILKDIGPSKKLTCPFRSEEKKKCLIYPVRPMVCRLMGVAKGMVCKYGNSANIDGYKFMSESIIGKPQLLNFVRWK